MPDEQSGQLSLLTGLDAYGRAFVPAGPRRPDKKVGMFFWLWIGQPYASGVYDATKILAGPEGAQTLFHRDAPQSPDGQQHFWGEPVWGYYNSQDGWVIRRQLALLTLAGVDFIVFDATNALTYPNVYTPVLETIAQMQAAGWDPPRAAFYTHSYSMRTALGLYEALYAPNLYPETWYREEGKPVLIAYTDPEDDKAWARREMRDEAYEPPAYPQAMQGFFRFYKPQWPLDPWFAEGFPWVEWTFPQPLHADVMSVSVASHPNVPFSFTLTRGVENWGRGWDVQRLENRPELVNTGAFFQSQWDHAIETDPGTVFVGGWNEWIAYKQLWDGEYMLCDAASQAFSRDIEPMRGGHGDAFYLQLIANIRRYKNAPGKALRRAEGITYRALVDESIGRDAPGVCESLRYEQPAPPNAIAAVTVSDAGGRVTFAIDFASPVSGKDLTAFQLLIGCGAVHATRFEGYDCRVAGASGEQALWLRFFDRGVGQTPLPVAYAVSGRTLTLHIPLAALGSPADQLYFKAAAYIRRPEDILSYYTDGSALPPGRLSYAYALR